MNRFVLLRSSRYKDISYFNVFFTPNSLVVTTELITPNYFHLLLSVMIAAEEVVGPGGDLIERPVSRRGITFL